jgi:hypothetical protein
MVVWQCRTLSSTLPCSFSMIGQAAPFLFASARTSPSPSPSLHHPATQVIIRHHTWPTFENPSFGHPDRDFISVHGNATLKTTHTLPALHLQSGTRPCHQEEDAAKRWKSIPTSIDPTMVTATLHRPKTVFVPRVCRSRCVPRAHQSVRRLLQETKDDGLSITLAHGGAA